MNILYITNHLNVGGITSYCLTLAGGIKKQANNVYIASSGGEVLYKFQNLGINYFSVPLRTKNEISPKIIISAIKLIFFIKKYNINIVHTNSRTTQVLGCLLNRFTGVTHLTTCHGFFNKKISRMISPCWGKKIIAISQQVKDHLIDDFKVDSKKIRIINNGIDTEKFNTRIKSNLNIKEGPVIGIIARLFDVKGHEFLIRAMELVLKNYPQAQLLIVGEGKMKAQLVRLIEELGINKNVIFIPEIADTREALSVMDIFVMPSLQEGLGLALMEAMSMGIAVIGSDVGGIKTLIQDKQNGLLVKPSDYQALSEAIILLLSDEKLRESLGTQARKFIALNFSQEKMVHETLEVYSECLSVKD